MEKYLNKAIKEVIKEFPSIGEVLNEYKIGCVPCSVGSCLLKDIVKIHNLSSEDEKVLMSKITKIIYTKEDVEIPKNYHKIKKDVDVGEIKYSPAIKKLVKEHILIKRLIKLIPEIIKKDILEKENILQIVDFIRSYADKFHHAKEEDILFKYFSDDLDIIKTMYTEHEMGRGYVRGIVEAIDKNNFVLVKENLLKYSELLNEHIKKEDEILYPWMDRELNISQIGELYSRFNEIDEKYTDKVLRYEKFIYKLEKEFCVI